MSKRIVLALCLVALFAPTAAFAQRSPIVGTWKLIAFEGEFQDTGEKIYDWGKSPRGMAIYSADGQFSAVIEAEGRKPPQTARNCGGASTRTAALSRYASTGSRGTAYSHLRVGSVAPLPRPHDPRARGLGAGQVAALPRPTPAETPTPARRESRRR